MPELTCVIPGTFDPITNGHVNVIERTAALFPNIIVGVLRNRDKKPWLPEAQRVEHVRKVVERWPGVSVTVFEGLLADFAKSVGARVIVRGLRTIADYEYEMQMASLNRRLAPEIDTFFVLTETRYRDISSSMVRQIGALGGPIGEFVPEEILSDIQSEFIKLKE